MEAHVDISVQPIAAGQHAPQLTSRHAPQPRTAQRRGRRHAALESWENEGGNLLVDPLPALIATPSRPSQEADALEAALRDMTFKVYRDFAEGLVGSRYNTFGHRSRVLRQSAARLALMRGNATARLL
jgi:hypothetical protein